MQIMIKGPQDTLMIMDEDSGKFLCAHEDAYIESACCSAADSSGYIACGCGGQDHIVCPAGNCTGIRPQDMEALYERIKLAEGVSV